jgi:hypothetical protein
LLALARVDTEAIDAFIDDIVVWAQNEMNVQVEDPSGTMRSYVSNLEFQADIDLGISFAKFQKIGQMINETINGYGLRNVSEYSTSGITLNYDTTTTQPPQPTNFTFERRAGRRYSEHIFFSSAPLRTVDHINLLGEMEQLLVV